MSQHLWHDSNSSLCVISSWKLVATENPQMKARVASKRLRGKEKLEARDKFRQVCKQFSTSRPAGFSNGCLTQSRVMYSPPRNTGTGWISARTSDTLMSIEEQNLQSTAFFNLWNHSEIEARNLCPSPSWRGERRRKWASVVQKKQTWCESATKETQIFTRGNLFNSCFSYNV